MIYRQFHMGYTKLGLNGFLRYFCCGSLLLLVLTVRIYTLVHLLCEWHILVSLSS